MQEGPVSVATCTESLAKLTTDQILTPHSPFRNICGHRSATMTVVSCKDNRREVDQASSIEKMAKDGEPNQS
jgi:hypothetical protein